MFKHLFIFINEDYKHVLVRTEHDNQSCHGKWDCNWRSKVKHVLCFRNSIIRSMWHVSLLTCHSKDKSVLLKSSDLFAQYVKQGLKHWVNSAFLILILDLLCMILYKGQKVVYSKWRKTLRHQSNIIKRAHVVSFYLYECMMINPRLKVPGSKN